MKRKKCYEKPLVERNYVELEDGVCTTGSVMNETGSSVEAAKHGTGFDNTNSTVTEPGFTSTEWEN